MAKEKNSSIKIQNVVVSADTHTKFSLELLASKLENAEYEPESFPGLVYRIEDPKASTLVFTTGKIICSGAKSFNKAKEAINTVMKTFTKYGVKMPKKIDVEVVNIVASASLNARLDLNKIVFEIGECEYEPEQFPGLVLRLDKPKVVFLLFNSGKIVCTGAKSEATVKQAISNLRAKLRSVGAMK